MLSLPPHSLGRPAKVLAALLALAALPADGTQDPPATAWQALLAERPEVVDDTSVSTLERKILQLLTPEQADAYAGARDAAEIRLPNGETLASWLDRQRRLEASGLLYKPLVPCRVLDTRRMSRPLAADEELFLHVRGAAADFSHQGGEDGGCGVPGLRGEVLRTNTARALMLSVEIHDAAGLGSVELWPVGGARRPGIGLLSYGPDINPRQMLVVGICDEESVRPCEHGDVALALRGADAHVVADVLGYFEPPWTALGARPEEEESDDQGVVAFKTTGLWQENGNHIYYDAGFVGIGTAGPQCALDVAGDFLFSDSLDSGFILGTQRQTTAGFSGGAPHDTNVLKVETPYERYDVKQRANLVLASPEIWGNESAYIYSFRAKNLRFGTTNDEYRRSEIELYNDNTNYGKIFFRTGTWQDPSNIPGTETNVRMMIDHSGNVGVGTTAPTEKLEVNGNFKLSGNMVSDGDICIGNCQ